MAFVKTPRLDENEIAKLMAARGISRKSAVQFIRRQSSKGLPIVESIVTGIEKATERLEQETTASVASDTPELFEQQEAQNRAAAAQADTRTKDEDGNPKVDLGTADQHEIDRFHDDGGPVPAECALYMAVDNTICDKPKGHDGGIHEFKEPAAAPFGLAAAATAQAATAATSVPDKPKRKKPTPATDAPAPAKKGRKGLVEKAGGNFDTTKAVELYKAGTKVVDIAVQLGYVRGTGQNRVRTALMAAGVYKELPAAPAEKATEK